MVTALSGRRTDLEPARVLIVDDDPLVRRSIREWLEHDGHLAIEAGDGRTALQLLDEEVVDLLLLDLQLPRLSGLEVLREMNRRGLDIPVVIVSGKGTIPAAVETTKLGAIDFIEKPPDAEAALQIIRKALERHRMERRRAVSLAAAFDRYGMVGAGSEMQRVYQEIERVAHGRARVLLIGESGTGKERVARAIHRLGTRATEPFVAVNCAAIPETMIEDELFGHVPHAFTDAKGGRAGCFQQAHRGTLLLDEIADMSLMTQAKVLRAIEEGQIRPLGSEQPVSIDVRVVAATNRDLRACVAEGSFREDLFFRLAVLTVFLPPLRERITDIAPLALHFLDLCSREQERSAPVLGPQAIAALVRYEWPGNVRELGNAMERVVASGVTTQVGSREIAAALRPYGRAAEVHEDFLGLREARADFERDYITDALVSHGWRILEAARALGINRSHLWKKMRLLGIEAPTRDEDG